MNVHDAPIGVFDSGLGGLSVARELRRALPSERLLYAADSRFCPYGSRSAVEISWRTSVVCDALIARGAKVLVIACNTATAVALEELRARITVPVIGLEPAVKPAVALTRSGKIAVLATPRTASSARLERLVREYAGDLDVTIVPAPGWADLVEAGRLAAAETLQSVSTLIEPQLRRGVDTFVLGCTHYPFLIPAIRAVTGDSVQLVDSGAAIARRVTAILDAESSLAGTQNAGGLEILTTGEPVRVEIAAARLTGERSLVAYLDVPRDFPGYEPALVASPKLSAAWTDSSSGVA